MCLTDQTLLQWFSQLEAALRTEILKNASLREYKASKTLLNAGRYIRATMPILEGAAKVYLKYEDGNEF